MNQLRERYVDHPIKWATIGGLLLLLISLFGPWATLSDNEDLSLEDAVGALGYLAQRGITPIGDASTDGFNHSGTLLLFLAVGSLVAIGAHSFMETRLQPILLSWGLVGVAIVIDLFVLLAVLQIAGEGGLTFGWGIVLAVVSAIAVSAGTIVPMWDEIRARANNLKAAAPRADS